ncbi:MAG: hypothetical protein U9R42_11510 [Bacteroidota bacterium]|nr:hypothetical protein [Bacteroidota bacterium]
MKKTVHKIYFLIVLILIPVLLFAPPAGGWNPGNTDPTVPIDGGFVFLLLSGIFYGVKNYLKSKRNK